jgi:hypothetical protein
MSFEEERRVSHMAVVDSDFLDVFMPYELRLAQRRAMVWGTGAPDLQPNAYIGLYLVRLEPTVGVEGPQWSTVARSVSNHTVSLLMRVLRDSDIPATLSDWEFLAVLRDVDPQRAYVVAQRFLASANESEILKQAGLLTRVGYVIYPLSPQPNLPVDRWHTLLDLARRMSERGRTNAAACGFGLLRGPQMVETGIPESDLVPLAFQNVDSLTKAGILQVQRIQMLSSAPSLPTS